MDVRKILLLATVSAAVALALVTLGKGLVGHGSEAEALNGITYSIDANPGNGTRPCDPVDATASVLGSSHSVAVCISGYSATYEVEALDLTILYDEEMNDPPEIDAGNRDDNPDLNDGDDPAGFKLGGGWDCTAFGTIEPVANSPAAGGDAVIKCNASIGAPDRDLTAEPGLLATLNFNVPIGAGVDVISLSGSSGTSLFDGQATTVLRCQDAAVTCNSADITKDTSTPTSPPPTVTPTGQPPSDTPTPPSRRATATPTTTETATPEPPPEATETPPPPPPPPPAPTQTPFGGPGGIVVPPPTGTSPGHGESSLQLLITSLAIGGLAVLVAGGAAYLRFGYGRGRGG